MRNKLVTKLLTYSGNPQFLSLAGNLTVSVMSIVSVSLLFRVLSLQALGMWVFFNTTVGLADAFRSGFLTTALVRACSGATPARKAEVTASAWVIALAITGVMGLLNVGAWLWFGHSASEELVVVLHWFGIVLLATLPYFMATCILQAEMRFDRILYVRLMSQGIFVLGVVGLLVMGSASLLHVVYCYIFSSLIASIATLVFGWAQLGTWPRYTKACILELAHFGKYSVGSYVGTNLLRSSDTFLINFMLGPAALAVYNLAGRFVELIDIPLRSFMATAIPALSAAFNQNKLPEVLRLLRKNAGMLTWAFLPIIVGTLLLADIPIYLIGGAKYQGSEAANLLRISMVIAIMFPIDRFFGVTLDVVNQPKLNLFKVFLMLGVNVVGDVIALKLFHNIYGVALASLPTAISGFVFGYLQLKRFLPISLKDIVTTGFVEFKLLFNSLPGKLASLRPNHEPR